MRIRRVAQRGVEVDDPVGEMLCPDPGVDLVAVELARRRGDRSVEEGIGSGEQGAQPDLDPLGMGHRYDLLVAHDQVRRCSGLRR